MPIMPVCLVWLWRGHASLVDSQVVCAYGQRGINGITSFYYFTAVGSFPSIPVLRLLFRRSRSRMSVVRADGQVGEKHLCSYTLPKRFTYSYSFSLSD